LSTRAEQQSNPKDLATSNSLEKHLNDADLLTYDCSASVQSNRDVVPYSTTQSYS